MSNDTAGLFEPGGTPADPPSVNLRREIPHSARIWNYWLGGKDNYEADREMGQHQRIMKP
ncbi:SAM-dependent methyltransferase [Actinomadura alba]|uniref:SAM-dependent methyltransferase n=1 Tax=Actinomadura alba TaxID=406431 RepID=UPI0035E4415B